TKVFVDTYGFDSSADAGIGFKGKLADGLMDYHITEVNGAGYGNISKTNAVDLNARVGFKPVDGLTLDLQFRDGYKGTKTFTGGTAAQGTKHTLYQAMLTFGMDGWRVGGNYIYEKANAKANNTTTKHNGYDVWAWADFGGIGAFGRYEHLKDKQAGWTVLPKTTRYVIGLDYSPRKNVNFSLAYDYKKKKNVGQNTANFTKDTTFGLFSQVKF
ncbi:MAG: hypothetical protein R8K47_01610, partial [Mariprofundaceae bacterium]